MGISVNTSQQQVTASVNDETVSATVSAGFGASGAAGAAATIAVGTVTAGAPGSSATVTNVGTSSAAVFDFSIPRGATGAVGATGAAGSAATVSVGTVSTGAAGSSASVVNSGTSNAAVFDFTIPTGATGAAGAKGDKGDTGSAGATGATGPAGVVAATAPVTYDGGTQTVALSIGTGLTTSSGSLVVSYGTTSGTACQGNDSRLSDARTPTSHAHGNITTAGAIGTTSGLPVVTTTSGVLTVGAFGTLSGQFAAGDHTHSQLHDRSHSITSTSDHTAGNWKTFHSNGSGQIVELAVGASGTVLTSNGTSSAPTFTAPAAATTSTAGTVIVGSGLAVSSGTVSADFATAAQARACASTTTVLSPALFQDAGLAWVVVDSGTNGTGNVANGGGANGAGFSPYVSVSTTANSTSMWRMFNTNATGWNVGTSYSTNIAIDWSKPRAFAVRLTTDGSYSTNQVLRVQWGKDINSTTLGQIASQGIGFEIRNKRVWLTAHNGTSLAAVDSGQDMSTGYFATYDFLVTSDGAGNVALYINGTQYATSTGGPTAASSSVVGTLAFELTNGGDATSGAFRWVKNVRFLNGR